MVGVVNISHLRQQSTYVTIIRMERHEIPGVQRSEDELFEPKPILLRAMAEIMGKPMLTEQELVELFGGQPEIVKIIEEERASSRLLGLPADNGFFYPSFQFNAEQAVIYEAVCEVNEMIWAKKDPWGVASWWFSPNVRLGACPADLVGGRLAASMIRANDWEDSIKAAAKALFAPIGQRLIYKRKTKVLRARAYQPLSHGLTADCRAPANRSLYYGSPSKSGRHHYPSKLLPLKAPFEGLQYALMPSH